MFFSTNKKYTGVWNSEVGSRKSMEKAEDIKFHPWTTTYIFTAVKIQLFIFSRLWNTAFWKYALYLINIFLYFITLYIIKHTITFVLLVKRNPIKIKRIRWYIHNHLKEQNKYIFYCYKNNTTIKIILLRYIIMPFKKSNPENYT